jgi:hypothetical protein
MKRILWIAGALACVFQADAQMTVTREGLNQVRVRNDSTTDLTALAVTIDHGGLFLDGLVDGASALRPGEERVHGLTVHRSPGQPVILSEPVTAAIFADGSTGGDPTLLVRLVLRRRCMLLAVEISLETLTEAGRINVARDQIVRQFKRMADSLNRSYLPPEQQVGRSLYQSLAGKLLNLPIGEIDAPFPPTRFVAEETAALNRQRVALLESQPSLVDAANSALIYQPSSQIRPPAPLPLRPPRR